MKAQKSYPQPATRPTPGGVASMVSIHREQHTEVTYIIRSVALLGLQKEKGYDKIASSVDFIYFIRQGVPKKALDQLISVTGISSSEMSVIIHTSDRTLRRYTATQKLNPEQSERVIELATFYSRGEEVFGSLDAFKIWMTTPIMALGNKVPKEYLDTSIGIDLLMEELGRIEQGIFA